MIKKLQNIYEHLIDDDSKFIFNNRLLYSITRNYKYIREIVVRTEISKIFFAQLNNARQKGNGLILDGAGKYGEYIFQDYPDVEWLCICDSVNKINPLFGEVPVYKRDEAVSKYPNATYVIDSITYYDSIEEQLLRLGVDKSNIINVGKTVHKAEQKMYFDIPNILPKSENCFIDCGAFHGESTLEFISWCKGNYSKIIAFEPDNNNCQIYKDNLRDYKNINLLNKAAYNMKTKIQFMNMGTSGSSVNLAGDGVEIEAITIDEIVKNEKVTYIKMDIEGSEIKALQGAKNTIKNNHPNIAISLYHKPEDIVELLNYCIYIYPDYRFLIRHYTLGQAETVAFAIPK